MKPQIETGTIEEAAYFVQDVRERIKSAIEFDDFGISDYCEIQGCWANSVFAIMEWPYYFRISAETE